MSWPNFDLLFLSGQQYLNRRKHPPQEPQRVRYQTHLFSPCVFILGHVGRPLGFDIAR